MRTAALSSLALVVILALAYPALARAEVDWETTPPATGDVIEGEVRIDGSGTHPLLTISDPDITGDSYAIRGSVRYEAVGGTGYLEMWSYFADGGAYFSRTLGTSGTVASLSGTSDGRTFEVPFFLNGSLGPERVELNLVMPDGGTVWIGPLELAGFDTGDAWWTESQAGIVGAVGGIVAGLAGAVLGLLGRRLGSRRFVMGLLIGGAVVGGVLLLVALVAIFDGQPRHVWYPLGLLGGILALVDGFMIPTMRRNYAAAELRRMHALDA